MGEEFTIEDALIILRRRFFYFLIPVLIVGPLAILAVTLLPAKYTAQGTILVESQQIPTELIRSTINAFAQERIQTIRQRVMTRNRLLTIDDKYDLFPKSLGLSETERVQLMRQRLKIRFITSSFNRRSARDGTIAFKVAYVDGDPDKAFQVANEFMTLFLSEDIRTRSAGASNTTDFFERESTRLRQTVSSLEELISGYKTDNANALPEHLNMHLNMLDRANREFSSTQTSITQLQEEERFLQTQLITGSRANNGFMENVRRMEVELARLRATYHDSFPEIQAKRDEIAALRRQMEPSPDVNRLRDAMQEAELRLISLERQQEPDPEEISAAEAKVDATRNALSDRIAVESRNGSADSTGIQLDGRLAVINNRIQMLTRQLNSNEEKIADLESRIGRTPQVERGLRALTRDYDNIFREYQDVLSKQQDAQLAENLEVNQQAEKFSILDPARRPDQPSSPDRPKLFVLAIFAALAAGAATALAVELLFSTIRGRNHLSNLIEDHPIAIIPYIQNNHENLPFTFHLPGIRKYMRTKTAGAA